jgi:Protein of unknown function (DUF550)
VSDFNEVFQGVAEFQRKVCPGPVQGRIAHLLKELKELEAAPEDIMEKADVFLLALAVIITSGKRETSAVELLTAARYKLLKNRQRTWRLLPDGSYTHHPDLTTKNA